MNCPNCGEPINDVQHFCSNCGMNLDNKPLLFQKHKKAAKKEFLRRCKELVGEHTGCSKLGQAAWYIATNTDSNFPYLQGEKMGCPESYELLKNAAEQAYIIFQTIHFYASEYNKGTTLPVIRYIKRNDYSE